MCVFFLSFSGLYYLLRRTNKLRRYTLWSSGRFTKRYNITDSYHVGEGDETSCSCQFVSYTLLFSTIISDLLYRVQQEYFPLSGVCSRM